METFNLEKDKRCFVSFPNHSASKATDVAPVILAHYQHFLGFLGFLFGSKILCFRTSWEFPPTAHSNRARARDSTDCTTPTPTCSYTPTSPVSSR